MADCGSNGGLRQRKGSFSSSPDVSATGSPMIRASSNPALSSLDPEESPKDARLSYLASLSGESFRNNADFDEQPRQVTIGILLVVSLVLWVTARPDFINTHVIQDSLPGASFRIAKWAIFMFFVTYSALMTKNSPMGRPHPMIWRALHGWNMAYCVVVIAILAVNVEDGEVLMSWIFPSGRIAKSSSGAIGSDHLACEITATTVWRQLTSIWFGAHLIGWCAKMLMLRDWKMCLAYSTFFELSELSLQFLIPEFQECWWDSLLMDWGGANIIGMAMGALILRKLDASEYRWRRIGETTGFKNRSKRFLQQFAPYAWIRYEWNPENDPRGLFINAFIWIVMGVGEVNSFFLLNILRLPNDHLFNKARQALLVFTAMPAVAEWYHFLKGHTKRIGHFTWLLIVTVTVEALAICKYWIALPHLKKELPSYEIWAPWAVSFVMFSTYFFLHLNWIAKCGVGSEKLPRRIRLLRDASFLPLLFLLRLYAF